MKQSKTSITIEQRELLIIRQPNATVQSWCKQCKAEALLATPEQASFLSGLSLRRIFRQVERETLHFLETGDGLLFICLNSLIEKNLIKKEQRNA